MLYHINFLVLFLSSTISETNKQTKIPKYTDKTQVNNKANLPKMLISVVMVGC